MYIHSSVRVIKNISTTKLGLKLLNHLFLYSIIYIIIKYSDKNDVATHLFIGSLPVCVGAIHYITAYGSLPQCLRRLWLNLGFKVGPNNLERKWKKGCA